VFDKIVRTGPRHFHGHDSTLKPCANWPWPETFFQATLRGGLAKTKRIGHAKLAGQALMCFATYNLGSAWAPSGAGTCASSVNQGGSAPKMGDVA
jgi:hypothetical protein